MSDLFGLGMMGNYEDRKVDNFTKGDLVVDTVAVTDSTEPYETGICHPQYNSGSWVIVELYGTKKAAAVGHKKWIDIMTAKELPDKLIDVSTAEVTDLCDVFNNDGWRTYKKEEKK